jgi:hypothetical protein
MHKATTTFSGTNHGTTQIVKLCLEKYGWIHSSNARASVKNLRCAVEFFLAIFLPPHSPSSLYICWRCSSFRRLSNVRIQKDEWILKPGGGGETSGADRPFCVPKPWTLHPDTSIAPATAKDTPHTYSQVRLRNWTAAYKNTASLGKNIYTHANVSASSCRTIEFAVTFRYEDENERTKVVLINRKIN